MAKRLDGKVAIVTGASSGIGRATALEFAREGASVVLAARRAEELELAVREIAAEGGRALACPTDVTREREVEALVRRTRAEFGRLDVSVHAAGGSYEGGPTHTLPESAFRAWLDGHLLSAFLCTKHALGAMLESGGGSVINVGTFVGHTKTVPGTSGYAAAKTGLIGFTRTVAAEYAERGIRANVLIVGGTDTPMFQAWNAGPEARAAVEAFHALKRIASPVEIARAALFLASDDASFSTGGTLFVDGGVSLL